MPDFSVKLLRIRQKAKVSKDFSVIVNSIPGIIKLICILKYRSKNQEDIQFFNTDILDVVKKYG